MAATALVMMLGACTGGADPGARESSAASESAVGSANIAPAEAPSGWSSHTVGAAAFATPSSWEVYDEAAQDGAEGMGLVSPEGEGPVSLVYAASEGTGTVPLPDAMDSVWKATQRTGSDPQLEEKESLEWPGAERAGYLSWVADDSSPSGPVRARYEMLMLDLGTGEMIAIRVAAPDDAYEKSVVHQVLASVRVEEER